MTNQEKGNKFAELMKDEKFAAQMKNVKNVYDAQNTFAKFGLDLSVDETDEIMMTFASFASSESTTNEMNEEQLAAVSGGGMWSAVISTVKVMTNIASSYWGSPKNAHKQTVGFWVDFLTHGWDYAVAHNGLH